MIKQAMSMNSFTTYLDFQAAHLRKLFFKLSKRYLGIDIVRKSYYGKPITSKTDGNRILAELIASGKPFMASRLGSVELGCIIDFLKKKICGHTCYRDKTVRAMMNNAGFFPGHETSLDRFCALMLDDLTNVDALGTWNINLEDFLVNRFCNNSAALMVLGALDPFFVDSPWSAQLENKKVLVIHPYGDSIRSQYQRRELLYPMSDILPVFNLKVITAVQSIAGTDTRFSNWFEALHTMQDEIASTDFDIALIGAGAYGMPLASYIKNMKKQAIHMGGTLQLLFGIKGKRWDNLEHAATYYNDYWIRPLSSETPKKSNAVEGGCYW